MQQDIYAAGFESRPLMVKKENYVSWSSRLLWYAKSRANGKLIHNSIINGPYVRRMIPELGDTNREVPMNETFHVQTDDELTKKELKQIEADDQAIQTILLGLLQDIYAAVDSYETTQEIWLRVQQMMKGSDIGIQEKKAKLFNECNLKFLNNLQPEWSRHVTIVHQIKDLHTADYTQLYDFLKYNQKEVDELKAERLAKTQDPLALMVNSNNPYTFPAPHQDQPSFNQNYVQQPMPNPEDITDPTTSMNMALALMAKAFKLNYLKPTNNNQRISSNPRNRQIAQLGMNMGQDREMQMVGVQNLRIQNVVQGNGNQNQIGNGNLIAARAKGNAVGHNGNQIRCYNCRRVGAFARNCTVRLRRRDAAYLQTQLLIAQKEEAGIQLQAKEFDLMAAVADLDEIEEVNANCILMANLQQASTSGTQTNKAPVYDSDGLAELHNHEDCYDNDIFNMFTQEEKYTELLEPIPESHQVPHNDNNVISEVTSVEQSGETVEQHLANVEETCVLYDSLYNNLAIEVEKVNTNDFRNSQLVIFCSPRLHKSVKDENFPIVNQVDARVQNFEIEFLKEAAKFVGDFKSLAKEADESLAKHKALELEIERLLRAVVNQDIMAENEYAKLWNDWYKKCEECKFDKISYDKAYNDMQRKIERLQAQLGDLKGKCMDTSCVSDTLNLLSQKLENENVELEFQKDVNSKTNDFSSTGIDNTKTRRPQPRSNTKNDRVPSVSKSSRSKNKEVEVEEHHRNLLLSKNKKHMSSACNNVKFDSQNVITKVVCAMCKQCLNFVNHDVCLLNYVNGIKSRGKNQKANVSIKEKQKKQKPNVKKPNKVGFIERLATPKPSKPRSFLRWSPTGIMFDLKGKIIASNESESQSDCSKGDNACTSNPMEPTIKRFPNSTFSLAGNSNMFMKFMGTVRFENDHVPAILGFGDLQWGNILITRVYFVEGLGHNLFSVGQFCNSNLEVAFRRNACFVRNLEGVDLLKVDRSTNLYTINLHDMASTSPICLMTRASSTKLWLWHQRLSHLNFDTINDLDKNDLVSGLPKFKYHKEHLFPSCEQGKSKRASHPPKPVPNSRQRLHLLHMDLCGPMRIASINGKRITVLLQSPVIIIRTDNGTDFKNQTLVEAARTMLIFSRAPLFLWTEVIATACFTQNYSIIYCRFNKTPFELINGRKLDISFLYVFGALCYPKNDRKDIGKLGEKGDIGFFIGYSADSCAYRVYNRRTKKIMETMNVSFDELSAMAFEQRISKPRLQSMTSGQISLVLDLTYASSTITTQQPTEESALTPTNSSSQATIFPNTLQDVDELNSQQQHAQQQGNQAHL
nr:hypothetical protein [Tanacetum cinerariifolium]